MTTLSTLRWSIRGLEIALQVGDPDDALRWSAAVARRADALDLEAPFAATELCVLHHRVQQTWQHLETRYRSFGNWDYLEAQHACVALDHAEAVLRRVAHPQRDQAVGSLPDGASAFIQTATPSSIASRTS